MQGNPEHWDEFQWERFLRMQERRRETLMLYTLRSRNPFRSGPMWYGVQSCHLADEEELWCSESEGDDWKITSNSCYRDVNDSLETIRLSLDQNPAREQTRTEVVELIARSHSIPYLIAVGLTLSFEYGCTGGTVAYLKRALYLANEALYYLREIGNEALLPPVQYAKLVRECASARNTIGCYISDLRRGSPQSPFA